MRSTDGQAAATWVSAVLSVVAIGLAAYVFVTEQRRANEEKRNDAARERQDQDRRIRDKLNDKIAFVNMCLLLVNEAIRICEKELLRYPTELDFLSWTEREGTPYLIIPIRDSMQALQNVWQDDAKLVLALSRTVRTLREIITTPVHDGLPSVKRAVAHLTPKLADLHDRAGSFRRRIEEAEAKLSDLATDLPEPSESG